MVYLSLKMYTVEKMNKLYFPSSEGGFVLCYYWQFPLVSGRQSEGEKVWGQEIETGTRSLYSQIK